MSKPGKLACASMVALCLSGHLVWNDNAGRSGTGTVIDLTVMDATIDDDILRDYARQLPSFTDLPL